MRWVVEYLLASEVQVETETWLPVLDCPGQSVFLKGVEVDWTAFVGLRKRFVRAAVEVEAANETEALGRAKHLINAIVDPLAALTSNRVAVLRLVSVFQMDQGVNVRLDYHPDLFPEVHSEGTHLNKLFAVARSIYERGTADPRLRRALTWMNRGLRESDAIEGFMFLWIALELLANIHKPSGKVATRCLYCREQLACSNPACKRKQEHRPWNPQAIEHLVVTVLGFDTSSFKNLMKLRNDYFHGNEALEPKDDPYSIARQRGLLQQVLSKALGVSLGLSSAELDQLRIRRTQRQLVVRGTMEFPKGLSIPYLMNIIDMMPVRPHFRSGHMKSDVDPELLHLILEV